MKQKHRALLALTLAISVCAGVLFSSRVTAAAAPSLFHNDERWYRDATVCLEKIGEVYYIPVDIFGMFGHMELSVDSRRGEFMVYNRTTGQYITVLYNEKIATVNGEEEVYLNLYKLHGGYYYVPAEYFCKVLSMNYEIVPSSSAGYGVSMRLLDGSQTKSFTELLADYDNTAPPVISSDTTILPPDTANPPDTSGKDTVRRVNYLSFNTITADTFPDLIASLRKMHIKAAFFITEEEMKQYPERIVTIVTDGHTVGITAESASSAEDFLTQINAANKRLCSLTKLTTRVVQLPGGTAKSGFTETELLPLYEAGYVLWDWTYDVPDSMGYRVSYVFSVCQRAVLQSEVNVLRMSCNGTVVQLLGELVPFLTSNPNYHLLKISAGAEEVRFDAAQ